MRKVAAAALLVLGTSFAQANSDSGQSNIIGGTSTTVGQFPSVVVLEVGGGLCTGTLIDPEWILTAAHCVSPQVLGLPSQDAVTKNTTVHFNTVNLVQSQGITIAAKATFPKPNFNINALGANDIGLIQLSRPVTEIAPSPVNFDRAKAPVGITVLMVGFGATEQGAGGSVGVEFALDGRVSVSCASAFGGSDANLLCFNQTDNKGKCEGDAGGPSFAMIDGQQTVVGVTSFGDQNCAQFGADTRVDIERDFIVSHIPQLDGCASDADCPGDTICFDNRCIAQPFTDGGIGTECTAGGECDSGACASGPDGMRCTETCVVDAEDACPDGFTCLGATGGEGACWPSDSLDDGGCCDTSGQGGPTALLGLGLVAVVLGRRRRR